MYCSSSGPPSFWLILLDFLKDFAWKCWLETKHFFWMSLLVLIPIAVVKENGWIVAFFLAIECVSHHVHSKIHHPKTSWFASPYWIWFGLFLVTVTGVHLRQARGFGAGPNLYFVILSTQFISYGFHRLAHRGKSDDVWTSPWTTSDCGLVIAIGYLFTYIVLFESFIY